MEQDGQLTGILFDFAVATGGNTNIEIGVWNETGSGVSPGSLIGSTTIPLSTIISNVNNQQMTYVAFTQPIMITESFFAGVILPTAYWRYFGLLVQYGWRYKSRDSLGTME